MNYSCLEELQVDLDLYALGKINILSKVGCKYKRNNWLIVTDDGICHLFDKDGNLDDIKKVTQLEKKHIIKKNIKKIVIPDSVTSIGSSTFYDCHVLTSVTIGNGVTSIGSSAFENCDGLTSVTIPDSVTSIGSFAFSDCRGLMSVTIPDSVMSIEYYAFDNCNGLTSVTIGNGVTSIGEGSFHDCNNLINLTFKGKTLKQVKKMNNYPWAIKDKSIIQVG